MDYKALKELITSKRKNIPTLAKEIGMSKPGLYLAIDKERLTVDTLEKIAKALEVPISVFFDEETPNSETFEQIKTLKRKLHIIEGHLFNLYGYNETKLDTLSNSLRDKVQADKNYQKKNSLIQSALDALINYDKEPDKLTEYYNLLKKYYNEDTKNMKDTGQDNS